MLMTGSKATGPSRRVQNEEETENFEFKCLLRKRMILELNSDLTLNGGAKRKLEGCH